ncbi:MAG: hypothetical protein LJE84_04250 [Gammaproteobacteria bacterium]|nr:hypothetical protein [Gammaproteobacteria bacterium]
MNPCATRWALWAVVAVFALRICGQALVAAYQPSWLPPMQEWYSGLIPWPLLLPVQLAILVLMSILATLRGRLGGASLAFPERWRRRLRRFVWLYFTVMFLRLCLRIAASGGFWLVGTIPVFTHLALAAFLLLVSSPAVGYEFRKNGDFPQARDRHDAHSVTHQNGPSVAAKEVTP